MKESCSPRNDDLAPDSEPSGWKRREFCRNAFWTFVATLAGCREKESSPVDNQQTKVRDTLPEVLFPQSRLKSPIHLECQQSIPQVALPQISVDVNALPIIPANIPLDNFFKSPPLIRHLVNYIKNSVLTKPDAFKKPTDSIFELISDFLQKEYDIDPLLVPDNFSFENSDPFWEQLFLDNGLFFMNHSDTVWDLYPIAKRETVVINGKEREVIFLSDGLIGRYPGFAGTVTSKNQIILSRPVPSFRIPEAKKIEVYKEMLRDTLIHEAIHTDINDTFTPYEGELPLTLDFEYTDSSKNNERRVTSFSFDASYVRIHELMAIGATAALLCEQNNSTEPFKKLMSQIFYPPHDLAGAFRNYALALHAPPSRERAALFSLLSEGKGAPGIMIEEVIKSLSVEQAKQAAAFMYRVGHSFLSAMTTKK